jgi:DNA-binding MarR family transcriptional regulator
MSIGLAFKGADRTLRRLRGKDSHLPDGGISHSRFELLDLLRETQPTSQRELADAAGFSGASISRMLDALVGSGFVRRERSESDRRVTILVLTEEGLAVVEERRRFWSERWRAALGGFESADLQAAAKVMDQIALVFTEPDKPMS